MINFLAIADCLVEDCLLWNVVPGNDLEEAYYNGVEWAMHSYVADSGTVEVMPIRGGAWADPMNRAFYKVINHVGRYDICEEVGKEYPENLFALESL